MWSRHSGNFKPARPAGGFQISNFQSFFLLLPLVGIVILLALGMQIKVARVSCFTQYGPCPDSFSEKLVVFVGRPVYLVSSGEVKKSLSGVGVVREVWVLRYLNGKIEVNVEVEKPRVAVSINGEQKLFLFNLNGEIVSEVRESSLPKLAMRVGKISPEDSNFVSALRLVELTSRAVPIGNAEVTSEGLPAGQAVLGFTTDGTRILMPLSGHEEQVLVGSLQLVLGRSTIEGKKPVKIDLRFKNAVVEY